ncbi:MAG TPA: ABC transporter substrate-binding protein [Spirochaetia bacterium]
MRISRFAIALAVGLTLTVASLGFAGGKAEKTTGAADPTATVVVGSTYPPVSLNEIAGGSQGITEAFYRNVYEPLLNLEDDGAITNALSTAHEISKDGLTYTFTIRQGVKFHDGSPLTAQDVKYSFDRVLAPDSNSARKTDLSVIDHVAVVNGTTVAVTLKQKAQSFLYFATYVWIHKSNDATNLAVAENGTGPYRLTDYQAGTSLTLERFDGYWGAKPKNGKVVFKYFTASAAEANALASGQIDIITNVDSPDQLQQFKGNAKFTIVAGKSTTKQVFAFNDKRAPFTDVRVRQALSRGVNKAAVLKATWDTYGQLIGSFVPPQDPWYEDLTSVNAYDPDGAKKLLSDAGFPNGFAFTLVTPSTEIHQLSAQAIKSDLAKIGVTVNIKLVDPSAWYEIVFKNRDYDATLQEHVNDRDLIWYGNPNFYWGYDNADVQQWVKDAQSADTPEEQVALYKKVARTIAEEAASSWLYLYPQLRVSAANVTGYPVNGKNSAFYLANIEKR